MDPNLTVWRSHEITEEIELELEEQLSNSKFENYSLDNIEKDNKNKIWTFNFSGESLPSVEELTLLIQKLRENFLGDYIVN